MPTSYAAVETGRASRYLVQLCRHFAHKADSTFDETNGHTVFAFGEARLSADDARLVMEVAAENEELLGRVEHVVADHLERFAKRDALSVTWTRQ